MKSLLTAASIVFLAACDSSQSSLMGPSTVPPPTVTVPGSIPTNGSGPIRINPTALTPGSTVDVTVLADDPLCFPNWDSTGRCRQFEVTLPADGTIVATLTLPVPDRGMWNPDMFIVAPNGSWVWHEFDAVTSSARMPAQAGLTYLVILMSYGSFPDVLHLNVEVR